MTRRMETKVLYSCPECGRKVDFKKLSTEYRPPPIIVTTFEQDAKEEIIEEPIPSLKELLWRSCLGCNKTTMYKKSGYEVIEVEEEEMLEELQEESGTFENMYPPKEGESIIFNAVKYEKFPEGIMVQDNKQEFKKKDGTGLGYCWGVVTDDDRTLIVSSFALHQAVREFILARGGLKAQGTIKSIFPVKMKVNHTGRGKWEITEAKGE